MWVDSRTVAQQLRKGIAMETATLLYQLNHGPDGWQTLHSVTPEAAEKIRRTQKELLGGDKREGITWRVFFPQPVAEPTQDVSKPPKKVAPARAPRKVTTAADKPSEGPRKRAPRKATTEKVTGGTSGGITPAKATRATRAKKATVPGVEFSGGKK